MFLGLATTCVVTWQMKEILLKATEVFQNISVVRYDWSYLCGRNKNPFNASHILAEVYMKRIRKISFGIKIALKQCPNGKYLAIKHAQTLFCNETFSVWSPCLSALNRVWSDKTWTKFKRLKHFSVWTALSNMFLERMRSWLDHRYRVSLSLWRVNNRLQLAIF